MMMKNTLIKTFKPKKDYKIIFIFIFSNLYKMKTWQEFKKGKLKAYIDKGMKSTSAMKKVGADWKEYKKKHAGSSKKKSSKRKK